MPKLPSLGKCPREACVGAAEEIARPSATNPANAVATEALLSRLEEGARSLSLQIGVLRASTAAEIDTAFDTVGRGGHDALFVAPDTFFSSRRPQFAAVAARERIPACYSDRETAAAGGLMSCGINYSDGYRRSASIPATSSRAPSRPICRSCSRPGSSLSSTCKRRGHSA
jgi:putative ABC transport system substrate-binding protein